MKPSIKLLEDRVMILPDKPAEEIGKILMPTNVKQDVPATGKVVAVGPGKLQDDGTRSDMTVKVGDVIARPKFVGTPIGIDDTDYIIVREEEILGIVV